MNKFKKKVTMFTTMLAFLTVSCAAVNAAGIADNTVLGKTGNMDITKTSSTRMDVNVTSKKVGDVGQVDWSKFNVGKGERVNFGFSNVSQTVINRVLGGQESKILGQLTNSCTTGSCAANAETSKVILINPAGIMFGAGSQVDLNSFTASTFDMGYKYKDKYGQEKLLGAQNLQGMTAEEKAAYQAGTLNKFSPIRIVPAGQDASDYVINGTENAKGNITFDSNYTQAFKAAGIDMSKFEGKTQITLDGTKMGHFNTDANGNLLDTFNDNNPNKSVNIVSDNITYKDSLIRTGGNNNYSVPSANYTASNSNVRLITADGVTFGYVANGYSDGYEQTAVDSKTDVVRNIVMNNSGLDKNTAAIESGDVKIKNISNSDNSNVKIKETYIKADKLFNLSQNGHADPSSGGEHGNITILGTNNIDIENSRLESENTKLGNKTTDYQAGGEVRVHANGQVNIKNSLLKSAKVDKSKFVDEKYIEMQGGVNTSGQINVTSNTDNVNITNSEIISAENFNVEAANKIAFDGSLGFANNSDISFNAKNQIDVHDSAMKANDINLDASASGKVNITSTQNGKTDTSFTSLSTADSKGKSVLDAKGDINIKANNTKIDGASLKYDNMKLYDSTYTNNVTVAGGVTLTPGSGKDINIETNGNLTFDNANVLYGYNPTGVTVNTTENTYKIDGTGNIADNLTGKSTKGDVVVKNNSDLKAKNINLTSDKENVSVDTSKLTANNDVNIKAAKNVTVKHNAGTQGGSFGTIEAHHDTNITAQTGSYTQENATILSSNDTNITAQKDATVKESVIANGHDTKIASNSAKVDITSSEVEAGNDASITAKTSSKIKSSTVKGKNINVNAGTTSDIDSSTLDAENNATIASKGASNVKASTINARNGNAKLTVESGELSISAKSRIEAGNDITANASNILVNNSNVVAGSDAQGFDANDSADNIGSVNFEAVNGVDISNNSTIMSQDKDVNIKAGVSNINNSTVKGENININDKISSDINNSTLDAGNDVNVIANNANTVNKSTINAKTGNATVKSNNADVSISNNSKVEAANDATLKGKNVNIDKTNVIAGSDSTGFDKVNDSKDTIGNVNIEATDGSVHISTSNIESQDQDVNITSKNTIAFGTGKNITPDVNIKGANNVNVKSTAGDITAEKTDMGDIVYGNRLTFDAHGDNIFTSKDSLKSVNVDYKAGGANRFYTEGDNQFVNSSLEAPNNFVESGHDVIMNNLEIKNATGDKPENTKTQIFANGNVTTDNVTNEDLNVKGGVFPQSVKVDRTGKGKTVLDINKTKLTVETQTVKDASNPDNGSITLDVKNADNNKAGLDLVAKNVDKLDKDPTGGYHKQGYFKAGESKWDENIAPKEGPEVHLNATDNKVSIANIETDKLTLDPNDTKIADNTNGTPTIEVKDQGGFNLDPNLDYNPDKTGDGYTYDKNYESHIVDQKGGDLEMEDWSEWHPTGREWTDPDGTKHVEYERTRDGEITDRITTTIDKAHKITFDNNGNEQEFTLLYDKQETKVDPGRTIRAEDVKNDPSIVPPGTTPEDFVENKIDDCPPAPILDPDSYINQIKLPREQVEVSRTSRISDNTVDQSANVMAAAAKVEIADEDGETADDEEEDLEE